MPGSAQPVVPACEQIKAACERAGFAFGQSGAGTGLWIDCVSPIVEGKPQPSDAKLVLPDVDGKIAMACKDGDPDYAARHILPASNTSTEDEVSVNGNTYGWYDDGWYGPGWYIVGSEFRRGYGFGGREGWRGLHHRGSHAHGGKGRAGGGGRGGAHGGAHGGGHAAGGGHRGAGSGGARRSSGGGSHGGARASGGHGGGGHGGSSHHHSDIRLKHDIVLLGRLDNGLGLYRFSYNGSNKVYVGVMAQEVQAVMPQAVVPGSDGYLSVYYDRLGLRMQTWDEWVSAGRRVPTVAH